VVTEIPGCAHAHSIRLRKNLVCYITAFLTAETVIAVLENSDDYEAFERAVIFDYDAESAVERELVLRLASVLWRLRRATSIESGLFESVIDHKPERAPLSLKNLSGVADLAERRRLIETANESPAEERSELDSNSKTDIADCFLRLTNLSTFALDRLSRYEHTLWRQARQLVFTLESLRRRRQQPRRSIFPFRLNEPGALSQGDWR